MCASATRLAFLKASMIVIAGSLGCLAAEAQQQHQPFTIPVDYYDERNVKLPPDARPRELAYTLSTLPGRFGGSTSPLAEVNLGREGSITLNLDVLSEIANKTAAKLDTAALPWVQVAPQDTRFTTIMVGMNFWVPWTKKERAGFLDAETGNLLTLLYVDRPCHFTGTHQRGARTTDFDIKVDSAGLAWVETRYDGADHVTRSLALTPRPVLTITPFESKVWPQKPRAAANSEPTSR